MLGVATLCFKAFQPLLWQENWEKTCSKWIRMKMDGWMGHLPKPVSLGLIDKVPVSVSPVFLSSTRWTNICTPISFYFSFYSSSRFNNSVQFNRFGNQQQHMYPSVCNLTCEMRRWHEDSSLPVSSILRWHSVCRFSRWRQRFTMDFTSDFILLM